jgi:hypothetical protein
MTTVPRVALVVATTRHLLHGAAAAPEPGWRGYTDPNTGTRVEYPASIFSLDEGPFQRAPGERFGSTDGRAHLAVFSIRSEQSGSPAAFVARNLQVPRSALRYERIAPSFFALSGVHEQDIYYVRCNSSSDRSMLHCFYLIYPASEKRAWDGIVTRISKTLRPPS